MQTAQSIQAEVFVPWLEGRASNVYTQFGEDGLISAALEHVGPTNRTCFEIGAADGLFYSNTLRLRELGWSAVLIEKDMEQWDKCYKAYSSRNVQCLFGEVKDLNRALRFSQMRHCPDPDLGVIDIDGQDYWLWDGLMEYRPRVLLIEVHPSDWEAVPPPGGPGQAGLASIKELGNSKGYDLVARTYCNALFIDRKALPA